jgi:hypothetical protein
MAVSLYLDHHVPRAIRDQLRRRDVDVLTAYEDSAAQKTDEALLERATQLGRVLFTHDIRFKALAEDWQRKGKPFAGLLYGHQSLGMIGKFVHDLEIVAKASEPADWVSKVDHLPFK